MSDDGDGFSVLREGAARVGGSVDLYALVTFVEQLPQPCGYQADGRIAKQ